MASGWNLPFDRKKKQHKSKSGAKPWFQMVRNIDQSYWKEATLFRKGVGCLPNKKKMYHQRKKKHPLKKNHGPHPHPEKKKKLPAFFFGTENGHQSKKSLSLPTPTTLSLRRRAKSSSRCVKRSSSKARSCCCTPWPMLCNTWSHGWMASRLWWHGNDERNLLLFLWKWPQIGTGVSIPLVLF